VNVSAASVLVCLFSGAKASAENQQSRNPAEALELPTVVVVGTTPLPGLGTPMRDVPANVQIYTSEDLASQRQTNITDYLEQNPTGVAINAAQGNPFQPDVNFRGFGASPLLGTPQGVSIFQDGVRVNEPFGDIVNWDLMPQSAIAGMQLIPGSNPAFGLNTLGGALAVYTKSGAHYPGGAAEISGGSYGRKSAVFEWGGSSGPLDYFATANYYDDDGWAEHNPSKVRQFFGKLGWQNQTSDLDLSFTAADNILQGVQTLPVSFLDDIRQAYTYPDENQNKLAFIAAKGSRFLAEDALLGGNLYYRKYQTRNLSSNVNDDFDTDGVQATNDATEIDQDSYGGGVQLVLTGEPSGRSNQLTLGVSADLATARFTQNSQDAEFTADRGTVGIAPFELETDADTSSRYLGAFVADTFSLSAKWTLTASGRYNHARLRIKDRTGGAPLLNSESTYARFNPAAGVNFNPSPHLTAYAAYNEGMRAPTAIELTCADPNAACRLPNDFLADPPLHQVISKTMEVGARGRVGAKWQWSAAVYRTRLLNDIQFISAEAGATNAGYFANIGTTRRQGVELGLAAHIDPGSLEIRYAFLDAAFQSGFRERSPGNSSADADGIIEISPGDRIPANPRHVLKARATWSVTPQLSVGANILASAPSYARGDENNADVNGQTPGFTVVNLDARYLAAERIEIFVRVNNVLDRRYTNFGVVGQNFFTGPDRTFGPSTGVDPRPEQFRGPGAPRVFLLGVRYSFGRRSKTSPGTDD
jgi:outer membrane receptor protein involved in Fe transport